MNPPPPLLANAFADLNTALFEDGAVIEVRPGAVVDEPLAVAIARSWSNAVTASIGTVAVIGGPLATGRRRAIEQVIRTTAPMHDGFAGGPFISTEGRPIRPPPAAAHPRPGRLHPATVCAALSSATVCAPPLVKLGASFTATIVTIDVRLALDPAA